MKSTVGLLITMLIFALMPVAVQAAADRPLIVKGGSINFSFSQMGVTVDGSFSRYRGQIVLDAAQPANSSADLQVDVASVDAGGDDANAELVKPGWLDAVAHPQARFVSKTITALGGSRYRADGTLSIKGIAHAAQVPFELREKPDGNAEVSGTFQIQRSDYKVGEGQWSAFDVVADAVQVKFHLLLGPAAQKSSTPVPRSVK
ncbi:MAG: YceI family protein [Stenotrophobium sp.]